MADIASRKVATTRSTSLRLRLLWNGVRKSRPLMRSVTGQLVGRAANDLPASELCNGM